MTDIDIGTARASTMPTDTGNLHLIIATIIEKAQRLSTIITDTDRQRLHNQVHELATVLQVKLW